MDNVEFLFIFSKACKGILWQKINVCVEEGACEIYVHEYLRESLKASALK